MVASSIKVAVRVRPISSSELASRSTSNCPVEAVILNPPTSLATLPDNRLFSFDRVFSPDASQEEVYHEVVRPLIDSFLEGYNATVLAYGQTSSGKTYTMGTGDAVNRVSEDKLGIIPRAVKDVFKYLESLKLTTPASKFQVRVSFLELYNEELIDLLAEHSTTSPIHIREDVRGTIYWTGVREVIVQHLQHVMQQLYLGSEKRRIGSTDMNEQSSRSHAIFSLILKQEKFNPLATRKKSPIVPSKMLNNDGRPRTSHHPESLEEESDISISTAKFHFVDLAGSERLKRTNAVGERAKEGISINAGLSALGNVISVLGDAAKKGCHVPYRDSKLTRLLQDSLGGNSQTLMIACISPAGINISETVNTLKYAGRARNIKNQVVKNEELSNDVHTLQEQVVRLRTEVQYLRAKLEDYKFTSNGGVGSGGGECMNHRNSAIHGRSSSTPNAEKRNSPLPFQRSIIPARPYTAYSGIPRASSPLTIRQPTTLGSKTPLSSNKVLVPSSNNNPLVVTETTEPFSATDELERINAAYDELVCEYEHAQAVINKLKFRKSQGSETTSEVSSADERPPEEISNGGGAPTVMGSMGGTLTAGGNMNRSKSRTDVDSDNTLQVPKLKKNGKRTLRKRQKSLRLFENGAHSSPETCADAETPCDSPHQTFAEAIEPVVEEYEKVIRKFERQQDQVWRLLKKKDAEIQALTRRLRFAERVEVQSIESLTEMRSLLVARERELEVLRRRENLVERILLHRDYEDVCCDDFPDNHHFVQQLHQQELQQELQQQEEQEEQERQEEEEEHHHEEEQQHSPPNALVLDHYFSTQD